MTSTHRTRTQHPTPKTRYIYTLLQKPELKLFAYKAHDPRRFCRNFRAAWGRLPQVIRSDLVKHWQIMRKKGHEFYPDCELVPEQFYTAWFNRSANTAVHITNNGLKFNSTAMDRQSDREVQKTIAHELAHDYQFFLFGAEKYRYTPSNELEAGCMMFLMAWGFEKPEDVHSMAVLNHPEAVVRKIADATADENCFDYYVKPDTAGS